jgi:hypothetical protein
MDDNWIWMVRGITPPSLLQYIKKSLGWQQQPSKRDNFILLVAPTADDAFHLEVYLPYPVDLRRPAQRREWQQYAALAIQAVAAYYDTPPEAVALAAMPRAVHDQVLALLDLLARVERGEVTDE